MKDKKYCPRCGKLIKKSSWEGKGRYKYYHCPYCGLEGSEKQVLDSPDVHVWNDIYDDDFFEKMGYSVMTYPESKELVALYGFREHAWLIRDEEGMNLYGSYSYVYDINWYEENYVDEDDEEDWEDEEEVCDEGNEDK